MTVPPPSGGASGAAEMRRLLLRMVVAVVLLHALAIAVFLLAGLDEAARRPRAAYVVVWALATFAIVLSFQRRIRLARRGGPRRSR